MTRWRRAGRLEAEHITGILNPPIRDAGLAELFKGPVVDPITPYD